MSASCGVRTEAEAAGAQQRPRSKAAFPQKVHTDPRRTGITADDDIAAQRRTRRGPNTRSRTTKPEDDRSRGESAAHSTSPSTAADKERRRRRQRDRAENDHQNERGREKANVIAAWRGNRR
ncbi:hypothetical protein HPB47_019767 [Ixodes persulcatus]|uniref:Uncharacterized protein n=1 Tax=Ixodes persulcatus TaxID=34615 RepID=A0AC60QKR8_IXOPE|nr:hypothetical protein HPB47_019767 [Ixodes persulcatus]